MVTLATLKDHPVYVTLVSVTVSALLLFSIQNVIMAGPYDCSAYDETTNQVSGCDKYFGGERSATGKVWNISALEKCVIKSLRETRPQWECCEKLKEDLTAAEDTGKENEAPFPEIKKIIEAPECKKDHFSFKDCDCMKCPLWAPDKKYPGFWDPKNLSHFNVYDFHNAPAFMLSTNERKAQNHLGYEKRDLGGFKHIYATGHRASMFEREAVDITTIVLAGIAGLLIIAAAVMSIRQKESILTERADMIIDVLIAAAMIFLTLTVFSHLYGYTYAENFLSPFPTSPHNATKNPVNGSYDLIEWKNLTFISDLDECMNVGQEMNEDPGFLFFKSTGVHGRSLKYGIMFAVILYLLPLSLFATIDTEAPNDDADKRKLQVVHIFTFFTILLLSALMIDLAGNHEQDDRCGADGYDLSALGATPGSHKSSTAWKAFGIAVPAILVAFSGGALLLEVLVAGECSVDLIEGGAPMFKMFLSYAIPVMLFLQCIYIGVILGENASDLCDAPYTDSGAERLTIVFLFTMLTYIISPLAKIKRQYSGETKSGMKPMKKQMAGMSNMDETTFI